MRSLILLAAVAAIAGCSQQPAAEPDANAAADANVAADANAVDANAAGTALAQINETTWEFTEDGKPMQESIDAKGNYIVNSGKEHIDHGTVVMKDGKACFTSAMTKEGEDCWSDPKLAVGESGETTSDKGEKLAIKRTAYVPLTM
ncbi:hypothetical protein [Sphingomonas sp.]|uniref:hypothetical protein n=1 Tax=Sphingomonas sp. TaxID=28214 RepID=UPI00286DF47C|nr:hypothetical protein [Sphingomonas sp.]